MQSQTTDKCDRTFEVHTVYLHSQRLLHEILNLLRARAAVNTNPFWAFNHFYTRIFIGDLLETVVGQ